MFAVDLFHERNKPSYNIVLKVFIITNWKDRILVGDKRLILIGTPFATSISNTRYIK